MAFYGRAGSALMKSFKRLGIDPLTVYGTVFVKCPVETTDLSAPECRARVLDELAVVQPRIVVVMGEEALEELNALGVPLGAEVERRPGRDPAPDAGLRRALRARHRPSLDDERVQARVLAAPSARSATGTPTSLRTEPSRGASTLGSLVEREVPDGREGQDPGGGEPDGRVAGAARGAPEARRARALRVHPAGARHAARHRLGGRHARGRARGGASTATRSWSELRGEGLDVRDAKVGDPDPLAAVQDACNFADYDELIVSTLPLQGVEVAPLDLPRKARGRHRAAGAARGGERGEGREPASSGPRGARRSTRSSSAPARSAARGSPTRRCEASLESGGPLPLHRPRQRSRCRSTRCDDEPG